MKDKIGSLIVNIEDLTDMEQRPKIKGFEVFLSARHTNEAKFDRKEQFLCMKQMRIPMKMPNWIGRANGEKQG